MAATTSAVVVLRGGLAFATACDALSRAVEAADTAFAEVQQALAVYAKAVPARARTEAERCGWLMAARPTVRALLVVRPLHHARRLALAVRDRTRQVRLYLWSAQ